MKKIIISQPTDITSLGTTTIRTITQNQALSQQKVINIDYDILIFTDNGYLTTPATDIQFQIFAKGNNTIIKASPFQQIFDPYINFEGDWKTEKVYPVWFGAKGYKTIDEAKAGSDSSAAINKAFSFKGIGEVYLSTGIYKINAPLSMPYGVQLTGEAGKKDEGNERRTVLAFDLTAKKPEYAMSINADPANKQWITQFPTVGSWVKDIVFENIEQENDSSPLQKCMLIGGGVIFERVTWQNFSQAVKVCNHYIDLKKITDCIFNCNKTQNSECEKLYAFDLGSLGDSFLFEHNQINDGTFNKGLRVSNCGGGSINANVINADVLIENSKSITFESNHMERGAMVEIKCSNVTLIGNYFWKREKSSVVISGNEYSDESIVTSINNLFLFYDSKFFWKNDMPIATLTSPYDIDIDRYTILNITNTFRYWFAESFGKNYTFGITLQKIGQTDSTTEPFEEFNKFSYAYSYKCSVGTDFNINAQFSVQTPSVFHGFVLQKNSGVEWEYKHGYYSYDIQAYWDLKRELLYSNNGEQIFELQDYVTHNRAMEISEEIQNDKVSTPGVLIRIGNSEFRCGTNLRLIRKRFDNQACTTLLETQIVDLPICGTEFLYDNGLSICGFKWHQPKDSAEISSTNSFTKAHYARDNVICHTSTNTHRGNGWQQGDMLLNIGNDTSWNITVIK